MNNNDKEMLFHKYMRTSKKVAHKTHESLECIGLSRGQPLLLMTLYEKDKQSRKELSISMERTPATITKMVKRLENHDILSSEVDEKDSRISRVCLTDKGKKIEQPLKEIHEQLQANIFKNFTEEDLVVFERLLDKIQENLGKFKESNNG